MVDIDYFIFYKIFVKKICFSWKYYSYICIGSEILIWLLDKDFVENVNLK